MDWRSASSSYVLTVVFAADVSTHRTGAASGTPSDQSPLSTLALQQVPFYGGMLAVPLIASAHKGRGPLTDFGLRMRWTDVRSAFRNRRTVRGTFVPPDPVVDLGHGRYDYLAPARELGTRARQWRCGHPGFVVAVVAPIVEEIFFRGLVLRSLERRMGTRWAVVVSSAFSFGVGPL